MTDDTPPIPDEAKPLPRPFCRGERKDGAPCRKRAAAGSAYCGVHGGAKRPVGRRTKLTRDVIDTIVEAIEAGLPYERAAAAAGIHRDSIHTWRNRGEADLEAGRPTVFADLADALTPAGARGELELLRMIRAQAGEDWRAALAILQARHPERYGRRTALDVTTTEQAKPRTVTPSGGRRDAIVAALAGALEPPPGADQPTP